MSARVLARADTPVSRRRRSDHDEKGLPASIPRQVLPRLQDQTLRISRARHARRENRGTRIFESLWQAGHLRGQRIRNHGHMVTMQQESHPGLVRVRSRNRAARPTPRLCRTGCTPRSSGPYRSFHTPGPPGTRAAHGESSHRPSNRRLTGGNHRARPRPPGDGRCQLRSDTGAPPQRGCTQKTDPCLETIYIPILFISRAN